MARRRNRRKGQQQTPATKDEARNQKRWFVSATGWGFELSLGSGTSQPVGQKVKRSASFHPDSKALAYNFTTNVVHNTVYWWNALAGVTQGTGMGNRLGDRIMLENLSIRVLVSNGGNASTLIAGSFRIMLIASSYKYATSTINTGSLVAANILYGTTSTDFVTCATDPHECRVICDHVVTLQPSVVGGQIQELIALDCSPMTWYEYESATNVGVAANLYWIVIPDQFAGVAGTTVVGNATGQTLAIWTDA